MTKQTSKYIMICVHIIIFMHTEIACYTQVAVVVMAGEAQTFLGTSSNCGGKSTGCLGMYHLVQQLRIAFRKNEPFATYLNLSIRAHSAWIES